MAKIPVKLVFDVAKTHGPKVVKFANDNKEIIAGAIPMIGAGAKKFIDQQADKKMNKAENNNDQYRELRIADYKKNELKKLDNISRIQLVKHKHEIESFISQIANEEKQVLAIKKTSLC